MKGEARRGNVRRDTPSGLARFRFVREGHLWHGLQLAVSIALAYGVSRAFALPQPHWAVMSALIVSRPDASATRSVGLQRLTATLGGALVGLGGAGLVHIGFGPAELVTLIVVIALAIATADRIGLRSASITALIVMGSGALQDGSPLAVAGLRTLEIAVGASVAMGCAWAAHRLSVVSRPSAVVSGLMLELAAQVEASTSDDRALREAQSSLVRATLRRLGEMVHGAPAGSSQRTLFGLAMRVAQDAGWLARQAAEVASSSPEQVRQTTSAAANALRAAARSFDGMESAETATAAIAAMSTVGGEAWRVDALLALQQDLRKALKVADATGSALAKTSGRPPSPPN
ncbi:FUSC family protein [Variovorax dokdonensis]|uniref:FUSC family protein n=1 Tax=Variovorax dokdonensis TaxID=344883 RepID=A0ABT7NDB4_9BURK|nr:FUSC family protein [Variovorax dokdonensis]MDM0045941.1 FUSC family protein [Variovorax dokdonensis]